ncbi:MAG: hypothetical protein KJ770_00885 [Actinobacteria bacterium]|nr:hypothetical protein [Actinomycetota bacterium]
MKGGEFKKCHITSAINAGQNLPAGEWEKTCDKCGGNLKEDSKEEFYEEKKKVENEIKDLN